MERSLLIINREGKSMMLEGRELLEFEEKFHHLYDAERKISIIQHVDEDFLDSWSRYDDSLLSEINREDSGSIFKKNEFVSLEYNLNFMAISVRIKNSPEILEYILRHQCSLSEAIEKTEQSHLWA